MGCLADDNSPGNNGDHVPVNLAPCIALKELATNTAVIKRPSPWIEAMLSTVNLRATQFKRVTIGVQRQLSSPDIYDQVYAEAWESVEDILYGLALRHHSGSRFELVFVANPTYDEEEIELGEFLERFAEVGVVKFART